MEEKVKFLMSVGRSYMLLYVEVNVGGSLEWDKEGIVLFVEKIFFVFVMFY